MAFKAKYLFKFTKLKALKKKLILNLNGFKISIHTLIVQQFQGDNP